MREKVTHEKCIRDWTVDWAWNHDSDISPTLPLILLGWKKVWKSTKWSITQPRIVQFKSFWYRVWSRDIRCTTNVQGQMSKVKVTRWKRCLILKLLLPFRKSWHFLVVLLLGSPTLVGCLKLYYWVCSFLFYRNTAFSSRGKAAHQMYTRRSRQLISLTHRSPLPLP